MDFDQRTRLESVKVGMKGGFCEIIILYQFGLMAAHRIQRFWAISAPLFSNSVTTKPILSVEAGQGPFI
jgi:hypothetical protein